MSDQAQSFITYLIGLQEGDRGALAHLRRSLGFEPGAYPRAYPYVEPFVGADMHAENPRRKALYLTAGLFALHPEQSPAQSLAGALGRIGRMRESASIEQRFITLLGSDSEGLPTLLRQVVSLLAADGVGLDYAALLDDLKRWLDPFRIEAHDSLRQRWARDFYRAYAPHTAPDSAAATASKNEQTV